MARFDEGSDELRGIHELHVTHDVVEDNTEFWAPPEPFSLISFSWNFSILSKAFIASVGEDAVRAHVQSFLDVIRLAL